jgi:hypothetical protein
MDGYTGMTGYLVLFRIFEVCSNILGPVVGVSNVAALNT